MKYADSQAKKNIRIQDVILPKSREKDRGKSGKREHGNSIEYGTDSKRQSQNHSYVSDLEEMRAVIQSCPSCLEKFSQFTTKKPQKHTKDEKSTQTTNKPFLINLIEERVNELCRQNRKLSKLLVEREGELLDRNNEIADIEEKFTNILYTLGQDLANLRIKSREGEELMRGVPTQPETPSYLKALLMGGQP